LDALEDALWEVSYPAFLHDEYVKLKTNSLHVQYFTKYFNTFNELDRLFIPKFDVLMKPIHIDLDKLLSISIYSENFFFKPTLVNLINFTYFNNTTNFDLAEDSYENFKAVKLPYLYTSKFLLSSMNNFTPTVSYATNLNLFRADFEESS
jgi:hypothetical protein